MRSAGRHAAVWRPLVWALALVSVVLPTRELVYALAPQSVLLAELESGGVVGPDLTVPLVGIAVAAAVGAAGALVLAVTTVRVRLALEGRRLVAAPRLRVGVLAVRAVVLFLASSFAFAMLESTLHWSEGLGWHGLHCLLGPVHRDAIPILAALTLLAVALHGAVEHLLAWARRVFAQLAARVFAVPAASSRTLSLDVSSSRPAPAPGGARGPPRRAVPVL